VLSSAIMIFFFADETLKRKVAGQSNPEPPMSTWEVLRSPGVPPVLLIFGQVMLLALSYTAVNPVFMFTSIRLGGFGFSDQKIALFIALAGASQAFWMLLFFPRLQKNFGTGAVLRGCAVAWPFFMAVYPVMNEFLRHDWDLAFWIVAPTGVVLGSGVAMGFGKLSSLPSSCSNFANSCGSRHPTLRQRHFAVRHRARDDERSGAHHQ